MIVQEKDDCLRLISQNDHAMACGELAQQWKGLSGSDSPLSMQTVVAIALHDCSWVQIDSHAPFDSQKGMPYDFESLPACAKELLYRQGLDHLSQIAPYAALLDSLHYIRFLSESEHKAFHHHEKQRRQQLGQLLGTSENSPVVQRERDLLRLLDLLCLHLCITPPGTLESSWPAWLRPPYTWDSTEIVLRWKGPDRITFHPYPFHRPFAVHMPVRQIAKASFKDAVSWQQAFAQATATPWALQIEPEG